MGKRRGRDRGNCCQISVNMTEQLYYNLKATAEQYNMLRSEFVRALLENVDDEKLYEKLLGPTEYEVAKL